jgi:hypothetical protein
MKNEKTSVLVLFICSSSIFILCMWAILNGLPTKNKVTIEKKVYKYKKVEDWNLTEISNSKRLYYEQL